MSHPSPSLAQLIALVAQELKTLAGAVEGPARFELRVCARALEIAGRELAQGAQAAATERDALGALLGHTGELDALHGAVCERLRSGAMPPDDPQLLAALRAGVLARLAIDDPGFT